MIDLNVCTRMAMCVCVCVCVCLVGMCFGDIDCLEDRQASANNGMLVVN